MRRHGGCVVIAVHVSPGLVLRIKYHGPTNSQGARLVVSDVDFGRRLTVPYAYGLNDDDRRAAVVRAWCSRYLPKCFAGSWVIGTVSGSEWVAVWVAVEL